MAAVANNIVILNEADPRFSSEANLVSSGGVGTIAANTPTKSADAAAAATGAVVPMVDGDGALGQNFSGIAKSVSTDTAAANGEVVLWLPLPGYVYRCKAKTSTTADTAAEIQALYRKRVVFDLTSSLWSVDAAAADALINCVTIIGGEPRTTELSFVYKNAGTVIGQHATS